MVDCEPIDHELRDCVFSHVEGFYKRYFEVKAWSVAVDELARELSPATADIPRILGSHESLSTWLTLLLSHPRAVNLITSRFRVQEGRGARLIYLEAPDHSDSTSPGTRIRLFGQVNPLGTPESTVLDFLEHARTVFAACPTRLFLHAFRLHGAILELWMFDRSGAYSSPPLDIAHCPGLLVKTLAGYALMTDEEVGLSPFIRHDGLGSRFITFANPTDLDAQRFYLQEQPATPHPARYTNRHLSSSNSPDATKPTTESLRCYN